MSFPMQYDLTDRFFMKRGSTPCFDYFDRTKMKNENGQYERMGWISFALLEPRFEPNCPAELRGIIQSEAQKYFALMGSEVPIPTQDETVTLGYARADYCYEWAKLRHEDSVKWQPFRDLVTLNGYDFAHIYDFETKKRFRDHNGEIPPLIGGTGNWVMYDPSGAKPAYRAATSEGCAEAAKADGNFRTDIQAPQPDAPDPSVEDEYTDSSGFSPSFS